MREMIPDESLKLLLLKYLLLLGKLIQEELKELQKNGVHLHSEVLNAGDGYLHLIVFVSELQFFRKINKILKGLDNAK